jgi:hypothetical protein
LAADPVSGPLLQPSCRGLVQLHQLVFGSLLGTLFLSATGHGDVAADVCGTPLSSARLLVWHAWAVQSVLVPALATVLMEWRLKKAFVRNHLKSQLHYGPAWLYSLAGKQSSSQEAATRAWGRLQAVIVRPVMLVPLLGVLWSVLVAVLLRLPQEPCETCADTGTCQPHAPCGGSSRGRCMAGALHARGSSALHARCLATIAQHDCCVAAAAVRCCPAEGVLCTMPGVVSVSGMLTQYLISTALAVTCSWFV